MAEQSKRINYRKLAFEHYDPLCAYGNRNNNAISNLVILCPNCHKMHDLDIVSTETIIQMRDRPKMVNWSKRMKDAGRKAALTRRRRLAGEKAAETRRRNQQAEQKGNRGS